MTTFFASPDELRAWFTANHEVAAELPVGFHKRATLTPSVTWTEAVDQALCFGWIDGVRHRIDDSAYRIRFTPRRPRSTWSAVNIARFTELDAAGLVTPAGRRAFGARAPERSVRYSYEQRDGAALAPEQEALFRSNAPAWDFFSAQPHSYRKTSIWWVVSAKRPETRERRLATLIADSAEGRRLAQVSRRP